MQPATVAVPIPPMIAEGITGRPLPEGARPRRIVIVRTYAFGDTVITLPVIAGLRRAYPEAHLTFITSGQYVDLFRAVAGIDEVYGIETSGSGLVRAVACLTPALRIRSADLVLDLQRSTQSRLLCRMLRARAYVAFDRFAPRAAVERYLDAVRFAGLRDVQLEYNVPLRQEAEGRADDLLRSAGYDPATDRRPLVCVNPAGCWPTKNWPVDRYIMLARELVRRLGARVLLLGTGQMREPAATIARALGDDAVNLVERSTVAEALALVRRLRLMVSDDSGLMHLSWVAGVPTVGLFGASRATWSRPYGPHTHCVGSEDLPCGACMSPVCARGDTLCLARVGHEEVLEKAMERVVMGYE